ncbi:MAG: GDP-mannose 4,6-dehydratase [Candidatus Aenigmarchaeota archaeon]|nr:GDP-mannose 4,6-dehydratase [Candidatus Aenigmarchaeota archaeon]
MKKALITGADGFIGSHLADILLSKGLEVICLVHKKGLIKNIAHIKNKVKIIDCDVTNKKRIEDIIKNTKPDYIFHLAAQSFVMPSWKDPELTFKTNIFGTFYLLEAVRKAGIAPIIVVACSSAEYGLNYEHEIPIKETKEFRPSSPYAVSKIGTDMISYLYWQTYKMKIIRMRFFNITGPRKTNDACSDFAKMIAKVEKSDKSIIEVGYLGGIRDYTDVRDAVNAVWLLAAKGKYGEAYNICTGNRYKVEDLLKKLLSISNKKIEIKKDPKKYRPLEDPIFVGDNTKIRSLGWIPMIPIEKTLGDMLAYWRERMYRFKRSYSATRK